MARGDLRTATGTALGASTLRASTPGASTLAALAAVLVGGAVLAFAARSVYGPDGTMRSEAGSSSSLAAPGAAPVLRVCADPNNLPFSNEREEGFENRIADLLARDLGATVEYTWWAQRRGFVRNTLKEGRCDVVLGVPEGYELALTTQPYYRSTYVFVSRASDGYDFRSLDDPRLRTLRIGVQLVGDDYTNTPPAHALARRGIVQNVTGYTLYGDYRRPDPPAEIVHAVARGDIDVALVWGPLAGYFARRERTPLAIAPVTPRVDPPGIPLTFAIAMGVRKGDTARRDTLQRLLDRRRPEIRRILDDYGVPLVDAAAP